MLLLVPMQCTGTGQVAIRRMEGLQAEGSDYAFGPFYEVGTASENASTFNLS
jgi:hypothetical protein